MREWRVLKLPVLRGRAPVLWPGNRWPALVSDEPRAALAAVIEGPHGDVTVVATHLTFIPGWSTRQLRTLVSHVSRLPRPLVLMGDLNIGGDRPARLTGMQPLATATTFPVSRPLRQLDHILADGPVEALGEARAVDTGLSDHRALVVDVSY